MESKEHFQELARKAIQWVELMNAELDDLEMGPKKFLRFSVETMVKVLFQVNPGDTLSPIGAKGCKTIRKIFPEFYSQIVPESDEATRCQPPELKIN
jgi:hypothetical protein